MNFQAFRDMLKRLGEAKDASYKDFGEPEKAPEGPDIAVVALRSAARSETMEIKLRSQDLINMILMAAGEPLRPWASAIFRGESHPMMPMNMIVVGGEDEKVSLTISYRSRTEPVDYAEEQK